MINTSSSHPYKIYPLVPEEGTLEEIGIRHWFTPNIYLSAIYYELDMDNEIGGEWDITRTPIYRWNANIPNIQHTGLEVEGMIKITPRWTLNGTFTQQKVIYGGNALVRPYSSSFYHLAGRGADAWVPVNPAQMYNGTLVYNNVEWGFSAALTYRYYGRRYFQGDDFNNYRDLDEVKIGDIAIAQTLFDGNTSIYFGIKNFNDCMSVFNSYWDYTMVQFYVPTYGAGKEFQLWPDAGRTYYMGLKSNMDFDRMKLPTWSDLNRMQGRLYGAASESYNTFTGMGSWMRNIMPF
jgi:iron complex outermembrane receptor protein